MTTADHSAGGSAGDGPTPASAPVAAPGDGERRNWRAEGFWLLATLVAVGVATLVPLAWNHHYYYVNDTETGAFGIWYKLGEDLRAGHIQILDPRAWMAGNYVAEGQWGLWSPIILLISLLASFATNAAVFTTALKIVFLLLGAAGAYRLSRSFGADRHWSAVVGTAVPLAGFTLYMDATAWVTGLFIWALLPWFWVGLRRAVLAGRNPAPALIFGYLTVTIGYVYGTIGIIFILLGVAVELAVRRNWRGIAVAAGIGAACGLVAVTVYLPGVLTAPVTSRLSGIAYDGLMSPSLSDLATSAVPTAQPSMKGLWADSLPHSPMLYIAWFLPLLALVDWRSARRLAGGLTGAFVALGLYALLLLGPSRLNALRFPVRNLSMVVMVLLPIAAVLLSRARAARTRGRLWAALGLAAGSGYLSWALNPGTNAQVAVGVVLVLAAVAAVWRFLPDPPVVGEGGFAAPVPHSRRSRPTAALVAAGMMVASVGFVAVQHAYSPRSDLLNFKLPTQVAAYRLPAAGAVNDGMVVGDIKVVRGADRAELWREITVANTWYMNPHSFANLYTPVGYKTFARTTCMDFLGTTCPGLLRKLFRVRPGTGLRLVDELSLDTLVIVKSTTPERLWSRPARGWSMTRNERYVVMWTRDHPVGPAGRPVLTSAGMSVSAVRSSDRTVSFRIDRTGPAGGRVVLSRLDWPGYTARNARIMPAADSFLLQVHVPPESAGKTVSLTFTPPAWKLGWATWGLALLGGLIWSVVAGVVALRRRRAVPAAQAEPVAAAQ